MNFIANYSPFFIAFLIGFFLISALSVKEEMPPSIQCFLGAGLGLGICANISFLSLILFNRLINIFVIVVSLALLFCFMVISAVQRRGDMKSILRLNNFRIKNLLPFLLLCICVLPLLYMAHFYLFGGWDAWSTWNVKAKFIFLGGEHWQGLFDPILWRASPHYPLLLPLINVWGWIFLKLPTLQVPTFTSFFFTFLTVGLLCYGLYNYTKSVYALLTIPLLMSLPHFNMISLSQYADVIVGYYLLSSIFCLIMAKMKDSSLYALISGISIGFLSFSKNEGLVAALILLVLAVPYLLFYNKPSKKTVLLFFLGAITFILPTLIFYVFYAPQSITFINGLTSTDKPVRFFRLKFILSFYAVEFYNPNWRGLFIVMLAGILFGIKRSFNSRFIIIPAFMLIYAVIVTCYYFINTYFPLDWWVQVSLHRIVYALLPTGFFWMFAALWKDKKD